MAHRETVEQFIFKAQAVHGNKYDYSKVNYLGSKIKVEIICTAHDEPFIFLQQPNSHITGYGCSNCAGNFSNKDKFIAKAKTIHNYKYNYDDVVYVSNRKVVKIHCPIHGLFGQRPDNHLEGKGCNFCGASNKLELNEFIAKATKVHGEKYNYSEVKYLRSLSKVTIICLKHGKFNQTPANHLSGKGCAKCTKNISKVENEWLDYLKVPESQRQKTIIINCKKYNLDAYDTQNKIIYEFYGDFWHGNPEKFKAENINRCNKKTFGSLYEQTVNREKILKSLNYNVISIWESDWVNIKQNKTKQNE